MRRSDRILIEVVAVGVGVAVWFAVSPAAGLLAWLIVGIGVFSLLRKRGHRG
jgi:hypothetical protein